MRRVETSRHLDGSTTYRVRFRHASRETSQTFYRQKDAKTFAAMLDAGGTGAALHWLEQKRGTDALREGWTFAEWFDHYVDHLTGVTPRTKADYRAQHRRYLTSLDELPLQLITRAHVAAIINRLDDAGRSTKTIANATRLLASCLARAVEEGHMPRNPAKGMRLPAHKIDDDVTFLTHEQFARILAEIPEHYRPLVLTLVGTGLRWSEATALQTRHIDTTTHTIRVRQAWKRVPGEGFEIGVPKSKKSRRTINVPPQVIDAITPLLGKPGDLVFTTPSGKPVSHANFHHRIWRPAVKAAKLDPLPNIHALRHTYASWAISLGVPLEAIQDQLGHESLLTTRAIYAHLLPALGTQVAEAAAAALTQVADATPALPPGDSDPQT